MMTGSSRWLLSVARKENPRRLEMLLNSALPPDGKVHFYG